MGMHATSVHAYNIHTKTYKIHTHTHTHTHTVTGTKWTQIQHVTHKVLYKVTTKV